MSGTRGVPEVLTSHGGELLSISHAWEFPTIRGKDAHRETTVKEEVSGLRRVARGEEEVMSPTDICMRKARILT